MTNFHNVKLEKLALRALQERAIENNLTTLMARVNNKSLLAQGWEIQRSVQESVEGWKQYPYEGPDFNYRYEMDLLISYDGAKKAGKHDHMALVRKLATAAITPAFGKWAVTSVDSEPYIQTADLDDIVLDVNEVGYTEVTIPDDFESFFEHLYGLGFHVDMVKGAMEAGLMSGWSNRMHCALIGPPGCGKSDLCQSLKRALGDDAVLEFDATATTSAGAIKELAEREILPRIMIVEEIEKADEKSMAFMLAMMDMRAEIRKTTARATIQRDTKLFVIATVNNYDLFCKQQAGALASRFMNQIGFKRPSREQLAMILKREVDKVKGDERWINPALDYCEVKGITDPRRCIAICLCGREKLLTGVYQKMMEATDVDTRDDIAVWEE